MARTKGTDGVIMVAEEGGTPAALAQVKSFNIEETNETQDVTCIGDSTRKRDAGLNDWSVSATMLYDSTDTTQAKLKKGQKVALELYPESNTSGKVKRSGTGIVQSTGTENTVEGTVEYPVTIEADGELAEEAVV